MVSSSGNVLRGPNSPSARYVPVDGRCVKGKIPLADLSELAKHARNSDVSSIFDPRKLADLSYPGHVIVPVSIVIPYPVTYSGYPAYPGVPVVPASPLSQVMPIAPSAPKTFVPPANPVSPSKSPAGTIKVIGSNTHIDRSANLAAHLTIGDDAHIGRMVFIGAGSSIGNGVYIEDNSRLEGKNCVEDDACLAKGAVVKERQMVKSNGKIIAAPKSSSQQFIYQNGKCVLGPIM